jgi:hypothetical protein
MVILNLLPFNTIMSSGKIKKSYGAKSGEQEGCGMAVIVFLDKKFMQRQSIVRRCIITVKKLIP